MKRVFEARVVVLIAVAAAALAGAITFFFLRGGDGDDRGTIIVRGGSVVFEHDKKWKYDDVNVKKNARPNQPGGHHVSAYKVKFENPGDLEKDDGSACPVIGMFGLEVDIDYMPSVGVASPLSIALVDANQGGNKMEPIVNAPAALDLDSGETELSYGTAQQGLIAKVTIVDGLDREACKPKAGKKFSKIFVTPLR